MHLKDNVTSSDEFTPDVQLRVGGPIAILLQALADRLIREDVKASETNMNGIECFHYLCGRKGAAVANTCWKLPQGVTSLIFALSYYLVIYEEGHIMANIEYK